MRNTHSFQAAPSPKGSLKSIRITPPRRTVLLKMSPKYLSGCLISKPAPYRQPENLSAASRHEPPPVLPNFRRPCRRRVRIVVGVPPSFPPAVAVAAQNRAAAGASAEGRAIFRSPRARTRLCRADTRQRCGSPVRRMVFGAQRPAQFPDCRRL